MLLVITWYMHSSDFFLLALGILITSVLVYYMR